MKKLLDLTLNETEHLLQSQMERACGYPINLLLPKGSKDGLKFRLFVMISEEEENDGGNGSYVDNYPNFPYCGVMNGFKFPDKRSMGFPFDRRGTRFVTYDGICALLRGCHYKNVKEVPVIIKHDDKFLNK